jgi:hypothetical protein
MNNATARVNFTLAVALYFATAAATVSAQVVRGTVKSKEAGTLLDRAKVIALNEAGREMASVTTDDRGRFNLSIKSLGKPFSITVRRLGILPTQSSPITMQVGDTADIEFLVEETSSTPVDTFKVKAAQSPNERALLEAERRGWKMFTPKQIELYRSEARSVQDLLRSWGYAGLTFPGGNRPGECVRSTRTNSCLDWVVDGQVVGPNFNMDPRDVYFIAFLGRTEAVTQWGQKTPNGALVIYTRMYGDKIR